MVRGLFFWIVAGTGCMPFALPPARLSLGSGPVTGFVPHAGSEMPLEVATSFRAGVQPLDLSEGGSERPFDLGAGYVLDLLSGPVARGSDVPALDEHAYVQGPYVQAAYSPWRWDIGSAWLRVGGRGDLDLLFVGDARDTGFGGSAVLELELSQDASGPLVSEDDDEPGFVAGVQQGRWAFAAFAGGTLRQFDATGYGGLTAGVSLRLPFVAGIACCAWPGRNREGAQPRKRAQPRARPARRPAKPLPRRPHAD
jgi:hypothetical protein